MHAYAVKLFLTSPLHIGELGLGMEEAGMIIHSDTLYSVIHQTWLKVYSGDGPLPIKISSAYPFIDNIYYLSKPGLEPPGFDDSDLRETYAKPVKSTAFLSHRIFKKWISRETVDYEEMEKETKFLEDNIKNTVRPRVKLDRINGQSVLYHIGEVSFAKGHAGLYFFVQCSENLYEKLQQIMRILSDDGIGGEKSSGYGQFEAQFIKDFIVPEVDDGKQFVSISLYYPASKEEFKGAMKSYQVCRRGGWTTGQDTNYAHKRVIMFSEGSVFNKEVAGSVVNVAPSGIKHPVYRYGKTFLIKAR